MGHARNRRTYGPDPEERAEGVTHRPRSPDQHAVPGADRLTGVPGLGNPRAIVALQRAAGNRAVAQRLGRRSGGRAGHAQEDVAEALRTDVPAPVIGTAAAFGARSATAAVPTLFGRKAENPRATGEEVQRYKTTDSLVTDVASAVGLGGRVGALLGSVTFESSGFSATVGKALAFTKTGTDLEISSQDYDANGTVKASGPKARVGKYEVGFLQTVYRSDRNFYYEPAGHKPGFLARALPTIFGKRQKVSDTCSTLPVRDGDAGLKPWYEVGDVAHFDKAATSTKSSSLYDRPSTSQSWTQGSGAKQQSLVKTDGKDRFRTWLAAKHKSSSSVIPLNYADWEVDYGSTVKFNKASPASSAVTPTAGSGAKVVGQGNGAGGQWPLLGDPVANDVATVVHSTW